MKYRIWNKNEENLEDFYINRFGKKLYSMFFEGYTEKVWGRSPKLISKEWGYQRVKGISISEVLRNYFSKILNLNTNKVEASLIESFYYPKYGPGQLYEEMEKQIKNMGGKILKNSKVIKINQKNGKVESIVYIKNGREYTKNTDILISSMPIKDLVNAFNEVDEEIRKIGDNLPYRDFVTVGLLVNKLNLKNETKINTINNNILGYYRTIVR